MSATHQSGGFTPAESAGALMSALDVVRHLTDLAEPSPSSEATIDELVFRARFARVSDLSVREILALAHQGHAAEIHVSGGSWSLLVRADGAASPSVEEGGRPEDALQSADLAPMRAAVGNNDAAEALRIAGRVSASVQLTVRNRTDVTGFHWISTVDDLDQLLEGEQWARAIRTITQAPTVLVVGDAGSDMLTSRHLAICGFEANCLPPPAAPAPPTRQDRPNLPSPTVLAGARTSSPVLGRLMALFEGVTRTLTWFHLATDARFTATGEVALRLEGARTVDFELRPSSAPGDPSREIALYEWATSSADPALRDAVAHAASLAILKPDDVATAAAPVLRTARSLYELSRRGAVAEALATRRSARHAALEAARAAAATARAVASRSVERALIQAAAAVAVVLSNASNIIGRVPALLLLVLIVGLSLTSLLVATRVEVPGATSALDAELADLDQYREALSEDDVDEIRKLRVIGEARSQLQSARRTASRVYSFALIAIVVVGGLLVISHADSPETQPTPADSTSASRLFEVRGDGVGSRR